MWFICERCKPDINVQWFCSPFENGKRTHDACVIFCCTRDWRPMNYAYTHTPPHSPEINWIPYPWETSAISGSVRNVRGRRLSSHYSEWHYGGVLRRRYYRMKAWNPGKQPLAIDTPVNIERHARRWINQFASFNLRLAVYYIWKRE